MACSGCAARREQLNKWKAIAYERAAELFGWPAQPGTGRTDQADSDPRTDGDPADPIDHSLGGRGD